MHKIRTTFTLSDYIVDELNSVSTELNEKKSHIVEKALGVYFDYIDEKIADKRLDDLENSKESLHRGDEVFKEFGV